MGEGCWVWIDVCVCMHGFQSQDICVRFVRVSARKCEWVRVCQRVRVRSSCADLHVDHRFDSNLMCVRVFMCVFEAQIFMWIINLTPT